jgi:hypothetical protein
LPPGITEPSPLETTLGVGILINARYTNTMGDLGLRLLAYRNEMGKK